jgi:hypothetical protein
MPKYEEGKRETLEQFRVDILTVLVGSIDEFGLNNIVSTAHLESRRPGVCDRLREPLTPMNF